MKCPGQDRSYWTGEPTFEMPCPKCGTMVELFRDEGSVRCGKCSHRFPNPKAVLGCAQWCPQAKECLGIVPLERVSQSTSDRSLAARLIQAVEQELAGDAPRLAHALLVFQHAKQLLAREGGDPHIVLPAALLLPLVPADAANLGSTADEATCVLAESPAAGRILKQVGLPSDVVRDICRLIWAYRSGQERDSIELKVVGDADRLARLTAQDRGTVPEGLQGIIDRDLHTATGKERARELFASVLGLRS